MCRIYIVVVSNGNGNILFDLINRLKEENYKNIFKFMTLLVKFKMS